MIEPILTDALATENPELSASPTDRMYPKRRPEADKV
jgi:hypothetical protein